MNASLSSLQHGNENDEKKLSLLREEGETLTKNIASLKEEHEKLIEENEAELKRSTEIKNELLSLEAKYQEQNSKLTGLVKEEEKLRDEISNLDHKISHSEEN